MTVQVNADRITVWDEGQMVESRDCRSLLAHGGLYVELFGRVSKRHSLNRIDFAYDQATSTRYVSEYNKPALRSIALSCRLIELVGRQSHDRARG